MHTKIVSLMLLLMLAFCGVASAQNADQAATQPARARGMDPEKMLADMQKQLTLTDEQVAKIRPLLVDQGKKRQELFQKYQGKRDEETRKTLRAEMQKLQEAFTKQLQEILTEDQMKAYQKMLEERQKKQAERRKQQGEKQQPKGE